MKYLVFILLLFFSTKIAGQEVHTNVEFVGNATQILFAKKGALQATSKLPTGEIINVGCENGKCYFRINYKNRSIDQIIGTDILKMTIYEFDFGDDGDNEIVVVNNSGKTTYLHIYLYSRGIIQKLFEKEIMNNRTVIKKDYIEYYISSGLDSMWNYYQGQFWKMTPVEMDKFIIK